MCFTVPVFPLINRSSMFIFAVDITLALILNSSEMQDHQSLKALDSVFTLHQKCLNFKEVDLLLVFLQVLLGCNYLRYCVW